MSDAGRPGCRIGRVRPKHSRSAELVVLPSTYEKRRLTVMRRVTACLDVHTDIDGFAFVVWGHDLGSTCYSAGGRTMPAILVPDFVRNRLLAERISDWTEHAVMRRLGIEPDESA